MITSKTVKSFGDGIAELFEQDARTLKRSAAISDGLPTNSPSHQLAELKCLLDEVLRVESTCTKTTPKIGSNPSFDLPRRYVSILDGLIESSQRRKCRIGKTDNHRFDHLYRLSKDKQEEGKERRKKIKLEISNSKPPTSLTRMKSKKKSKPTKKQITLAYETSNQHSTPEEMLGHNPPLSHFNDDDSIKNAFGSPSPPSTRSPSVKNCVPKDEERVDNISCDLDRASPSSMNPTNQLPSPEEHGSHYDVKMLSNKAPAATLTVDNTGSEVSDELDPDIVQNECTSNCPTLGLLEALKDYIQFVTCAHEDNIDEDSFDENDGFVEVLKKIYIEHKINDNENQLEIERNFTIQGVEEAECVPYQGGTAVSEKEKKELGEGETQNKENEYMKEDKNTKVTSKLRRGQEAECLVGMERVMVSVTSCPEKHSLPRPSPPRFQRLYDLSSEKQHEGMVRRQKIKKENVDKNPTLPPPPRKNVNAVRSPVKYEDKSKMRSEKNVKATRFQLLYDLSREKQELGKQRRKDIKKSAAEANPSPRQYFGKKSHNVFRERRRIEGSNSQSAEQPTVETRSTLTESMSSANCSSQDF